MNMWNHSDIETFNLPYLEHQTLANLAKGVYTMEVWRQTIAVGKETPWCQYACEAVIVVLNGRGVCRVQGRQQAFLGEATLVIESDVAHQLVNTGSEPLEILAVLGMTPVTARGVDGRRITQPWDTSCEQEPLRMCG